MKFTDKWVELEKNMLNEAAQAQKLLALNVVLAVKVYFHMLDL